MKQLDEEILNRLHGGPDGYRALVREVAAAYPDVRADVLEDGLLRAARDLDEVLSIKGDPTNEARLARRLAVLLRMDIDTVAAEDQSAPTLGRLLDWWSANDDFFLRL